MHFVPFMLYEKFRRQYTSLQNITYHAGTKGLVDVQLCSFLTSALGGGWMGNTRNRPIYPGREPRYLVTGGWLGPRAGLERYGGEKIYCPHWYSKPERSKP
jgi:hypothetical protein